MNITLRNIKGRMTPILQYGVVNCLNAALILLQDEDVEVRNAATRFASQLKRSTLLPQDCQISTFLGTYVYFILVCGFQKLFIIINLQISCPVLKICN